MTKIEAITKSVNFINNNLDGSANKVMLMSAFADFVKNGSQEKLKATVKQVTVDATDPIVQYEARRISIQLH